MTTLPVSRQRSSLQAVAAVAAVLLLAGWLALRARGLTPSVFADEWYYSLMSRLQPIEKSMLPSYLYLWLFSASSACGDGFLDCVRGANALLFAAAAPFVYLSARQVTGRGTAAFIALMATLAPLNLYTVYFMPESTYYFGFCVLSWIALAGRTWSRPVQALASGAALGTMTLVKVHGLFLLPALCLYLVYLAWSEGGAWLRRAALGVALAAAATFAVKFGLGWLLAGKAGLSLFGPFYGAAADTAGGSKLMRLAKPFLVNGAGHLMGLTLLNALPLALLAWSLLRLPRRAEVEAASLLRAWALLTAGAAAGVTIMYTAMLVTAGVFYEALRLHLRYYSFVLPLLWMVAAAGNAGTRATGARLAPLRWFLALLLSAVAVVAWFKLPGYNLNIADSPEIRSLNFGEPASVALVVLQVAALLLWGAGSAYGRKLFLFAAMPLTVALGLVTIHDTLATHVPTPADKAGMFARQHLPAADRGKITVAGTYAGELMRAQFHLDHPDTPTLELLPESPLEYYHLPPRSNWLVVFGHHPLPPGVKPYHVDPDFVVIKLDQRRKILASSTFTQPFGPGGLVASAEGLSSIENFGRWSDAKHVVLHLAMPLPKSGFVLIKGMSYGANTEKPFTLRAGASSTTFRITGSMQEVAVPFETDGEQRTLTIDVPQPMAPSENGNPNDRRTLGIGLGEIAIATRAD